MDLGGLHWMTAQVLATLMLHKTVAANASLSPLFVSIAVVSCPFQFRFNMAPGKKSKSKAADPAPPVASNNKKGPRRNIVKSGNAGGNKSTAPDQQPSEKVACEWNASIQS